MASQRRFEFTTSALTKRALPPAPDSAASDLIYWDTHRDAPPGFGVRVGKGRPGKEQPVRTFVVQRDMPNGKTKRVSLGRWLDEVTLEEARERAREVRAQLKEGIDPAAAERARRAEGATLRDAFERHLRGMESLASRGRRQPRSISDMRGDMERYFATWLDRPLHTFSRVELDDFHQEVTRSRGPYAANRACRAFRSAWNTMARLHEALPACPTAGIQWNPEERVGKPIQWSVLPEFWRAIDQVKNPVRADLVRVLVLTGLRSLDARTIRWEDIAALDTDEPTLHRPNPKGGPKKAFTLPVTRAVAEVLRRRREENMVLFADCPWVFPTADRGGRAVVHVKNAEEDSLHGFGYTPHRARDTYATACEEAGISVMATKLLLNHRDQTITEGYQRGVSMGFLREAAERVAAFLLEKARVAKAA